MIQVDPQDVKTEVKDDVVKEDVKTETEVSQVSIQEVSPGVAFVVVTQPEVKIEEKTEVTATVGSSEKLSEQVVGTPALVAPVIPIPEVKNRGVGLWLDGSKVIVTVYVYLDPDDKIILIVLEPIEETVFKIIEVKGDFSVPTRSEYDRYRERASKWNEDAQALMVSKIKIKQQFLSHNLKKLCVDGQDQNLTFNKNGILSLESEQLLERLHPMTLELLLLKFERESAIMV